MFSTPELCFFVVFVCFGVLVTIFNDLLNAEKMRDARTIILALVSRRDLWYVSENAGFRFYDRAQFIESCPWSLPLYILFCGHDIHIYWYIWVSLFGGLAVWAPGYCQKGRIEARAKRGPEILVVYVYLYIIYIYIYICVGARGLLSIWLHIFQNMSGGAGWCSTTDDIFLGTCMLRFVDFFSRAIVNRLPQPI